MDNFKREGAPLNAKGTNRNCILTPHGVEKFFQISQNQSIRSMEKVRIRVNQRDIKNGKPGKSYSCPIALAIKRKIKDSEDVVVGLDVIYVNRKNRAISNPGNVFRWVRDFDAKRLVKPFSFTIYFP
jgi:hypothetical protein